MDPSGKRELISVTLCIFVSHSLSLSLFVDDIVNTIFKDTMQGYSEKSKALHKAVAARSRSQIKIHVNTTKECAWCGSTAAGNMEYPTGDTIPPNGIAIGCVYFICIYVYIKSC